MATSKTIAALIGPTLIASAASIFFNLEAWPAMRERGFDDPALIFVTGYPYIRCGTCDRVFSQSMDGRLAGGGDHARLAYSRQRPFTNTFPDAAR